MRISPQIRNVLLNARGILSYVHCNWPDTYHDAVSTCTVCRTIKQIEDLLSETPGRKQQKPPSGAVDEA